jgi:hypothetical protein
MLGAGDVFKRSTALVGLELHCTPDADLNRRRPATLGKTNGRGYFGLYSFSLILHRLNRDSDAQMSCNSAIGGIPLGRHGGRAWPERSRRECPRHTLHSGMQSPGRNQGVIVKQCAEKYVDHDVDCPDQHIGHCHFCVASSRHTREAEYPGEPERQPPPMREHPGSRHCIRTGRQNSRLQGRQRSTPFSQPGRDRVPTIVR